MCMFTIEVQSVARTRIFARRDGADSQILVYSMDVALGSAGAMVLPLPVAPGSPDDSVAFVDLSGYPGFFDDLDRVFPVPGELVLTRDGAMAGGIPVRTTLVVHDVGDFEASFVPSVGDFDRLDRRFRLAPEVWASLPQFADWGFSVVKLKDTAAARPGFWRRLLGRPPAAAVKTIHPIALSFPTRDPDRLFFPTVHVHDGVVHETARFDHALYCQLTAGTRAEVARANPDATPPPPEPGDYTNASPLGRWTASGKVLCTEMKPRSAGLADLAAPAYKREIHGTERNQDVWIDLPPSSSEEV